MPTASPCPPCAWRRRSPPSCSADASGADLLGDGANRICQLRADLGARLEPREDSERRLEVALVPGDHVSERQDIGGESPFGAALDGERILPRPGRRAGEVEVGEEPGDRVRLD